MADKTKYLIGERHQNKYGDWYTVISYTPNNRRRNIRFDSGYERCVLVSQLNHGMIRDVNTPTYYNIGCAGMENECEHFLFNRWINMLGRCYNPKHSGYNSYGAKSIMVSDELLNFKNYVEIVEQLPNYNYLAADPGSWDIDKDYKSNKEKIYSKDTICIMKKNKNIELENHDKKIKVQQFQKDNILIDTFESICDAEKATGINKRNISKVINGYANTAGGYIWRKYYDTEF